MIRTNTPSGDVVLVCSVEERAALSLAITRLSQLTHHDVDAITEGDFTHPFWHRWSTAQCLVGEF